MPRFESVPSIPLHTAAGACFFCKQTKPGKYVRTYTTVEYIAGVGGSRRARDGELIMCKTCAETIGAAVGCASRRSSEGLRRENERVRAENLDLKEKLGELEPLADMVAKFAGQTVTIEKIPVAAVTG